MDKLLIRDLTIKDEYFVGTCTHIYESNDYDRGTERRIKFMRKSYEQGLRVKVALLNGEHVGFIHAIPIEISPLGPIGENLMSIPCLIVQPNFRRMGIGKELIREAFKEAIKQDKGGIVTVGYSTNLWFMPYEFFKKVGFQVLKKEKIKLSDRNIIHERTLLWKTYESNLSEPDFLRPNYSPRILPGKIVVDVFYNSFCPISLIQIERVRRVVREFSSYISLNFYCSDDRETLMKYQIPQGIFINGKELGTIFAVSEYEIRKIIIEELKKIKR